MSDTRTFRVVDEDGDYYEIIGDPMDALNAAYRERAHLVALLAAVYPSHIGRTDPESPNWAVVTIELPTGQACWHVASDDMDLFEHVRPTSADDPGWDGHTTVEKYGRVDEMATQVAAARASGEQPQDERDGDVRAYPGRPGDVWQDQEGDHWVMCADGQVRWVHTGSDPCHPAVAEDVYGPMVALDAREAKASER